MKNILIPIDFSENSLNALHFGQLLFKEKECTFYLYSAYMVKQSNLLGDEWGNEWVEAVANGIDEDLKDVLDQVKTTSNNKHHHFKGISKLDAFIPSLKKLVAEYDIDFIVMGTKGAKGLKEVFLGSNAVKVLNAITDCPTIVVPQNYMPRKVKQIIFSTNYKRPFSKTELAPLLKMVKRLNAYLQVVQIMDENILSEKQKLHKKALISILDDVSFDFKKIVFDTSEAQAIRDYVIENESDMVALIHHKQHFFYKLTDEDVVDKLSFNSNVPVLILPEIVR